MVPPKVEVVECPVKVDIDAIAASEERLLIAAGVGHVLRNWKVADCRFAVRTKWSWIEQAGREQDLEHAHERIRTRLIDLFVSGCHGRGGVPEYFHEQVAVDEKGRDVVFDVLAHVCGAVACLAI